MILEFPTDTRWTARVLAAGIVTLIGDAVTTNTDAGAILIGSKSGVLVADIFQHGNKILVDVDRSMFKDTVFFDTLKIWHEQSIHRSKHNEKARAKAIRERANKDSSEGSEGRNQSRQDPGDMGRARTSHAAIGKIHGVGKNVVVD